MTYQKLLEFWHKLKIQKNFRIGLAALGWFLIFVLVLDVGLNFWIRSSLRRGFTEDARPDTKIEARISWLSVSDLISRRIHSVSVVGLNCSLNKLRFRRIVIHNSGFTFNLPVLLTAKRLELTSINQTRVTAVIGQEALQEYILFKYPQSITSLKILPDMVRVAGAAVILNRKLPVQLEGNFKISSDKTIRFYPERLLLSGRAVSSKFLDFVGTQIPLDFPLLEYWPLKITQLDLKEGSVAISFQEMAPEKRL